MRERAVRMVHEHAAEHASSWAAMEAIAPKPGCTAETLRRWVRQAERDTGQRPGLTTDDRRRLTELERENRDLARGQCQRGRAVCQAHTHHRRRRESNPQKHVRPSD